MNKYILIRKVTKKECDWLEKDFEIGDIVYEYTGYTYGCISHRGTAFTIIPDETPFFELPNDSVKFYTKQFYIVINLMKLLLYLYIILKIKLFLEYIKIA